MRRYGIMTECWQFYPSKRPNFKDLVGVLGQCASERFEQVANTS